MMKRIPNGKLQDWYLETETNTASKRRFFELLEKGDHASIGCATAMATHVMDAYFEKAKAAEALWMYA